MSGAGRSSALNVFEDLPGGGRQSPLSLGDLICGAAERALAIGVDIRTRFDFVGDAFDSELNRPRAETGQSVTTIFWIAMRMC